MSNREQQSKSPIPEPLGSLSDDHPWYTGFHWPNDGRPPYIVKTRLDADGTTHADIYVFDRKGPLRFIPHHLTDETAGPLFDEGQRPDSEE